MFELFFGTKPEIVVEVRRSWAEIIIESARDHTAAWVAIMQAFIIAHTIEIIVLAMIIIVLISVFKQMHKGRPSDLSLLQKEQATQISITNNITTTNDQSGGDMENSGNQTNNHTIEPAVLINPANVILIGYTLPVFVPLINNGELSAGLVVITVGYTPPSTPLIAILPAPVTSLAVLL